MWFGILTPGAHASRPTPTVDEVTIYAWTRDGRARIDGPAYALHGGLRVLRRQFHEQEGGRSSPPRCFVCREPIPVPAPAEARADAIDTGPGQAPPSLDEIDDAAHSAAAALAGGTASLVLVHLDDLPADGTDPSPLEEEALVVLPGQPAALLVPLLALPPVLEIAEAALQADAPVPCERCGTVLPAGSRERDAANRQDRRAAARRSRSPARRGGRRAA
ncbi:hypothetical protein DSM112329_01297 [Paraconexibacter sp. AEG42_29]|uniref:DUF177 domain-containing protein n=1 Tax=Paraconexibacter sp. AEG42_29 TaxID=2997339 RepID=A0AAU7AS44_9ACTN